MDFLQQAAHAQVQPPLTERLWEARASPDQSQMAQDAVSVEASDAEALAILLPLLILLSSLLFLLLLFLLFLIVARRRRGISLPDTDGPLDLTREEELHGDGGLDGVEQRWLDTVDEPTRTGYIRAKAWQSQFPPNSQPTDITLTQFLAIQEKGVSAWCFEPDFDAISPPFMVTGRTEILFLADGIGMAASEGGGACVQSNLPLPKINEVYYWEAKLFEKPESTTVVIGLATKPYPSFRLPGWNRYSVGYFSNDGFKSHNYPFTASSYGPPLLEGDVIGLGYRPRTGTVFFTRNGKKLEDAYIGLNRHNLFPTVGANGAANIQVNLGQAGFVFIEANVKKWGLAPSSGTLAPPPAYGSERGSILLETADGTVQGLRMTMPNQRLPRRHRRRRRDQSSDATGEGSSSQRRDSSPFGSDDQASVSSDRISEQPDAEEEETLDDALLSPEVAPADRFTTSHRRDSQTSSVDLPHNPPTPNVMDISLHSLQNISPFSTRLAADQLEEEQERAYDRPPPTPMEGSPPRDGSSAGQRRAVRPPDYNTIDPNVYAAGVAEAMLGESFAAFQAAQSGQLAQSLPTNSVYEGRTAAHPASPRLGDSGAAGWFSRWLGLQPSTPAPGNPAPSQSVRSSTRAGAN